MHNETILSKYMLEEKLLEMSLFTNYRGKDSESGQAIFATLINREIIPSDDFISRFDEIAQALQTIDNPYAAKVLAYGEYEGRAAVVQEYVEGQTLAAMLVGSEGLPENLVLDITQQIGSYLQDIHQADLIHGSLDLENVLLSSKGIVSIRDAGLAKGVNLPHLLVDGVIEVSAFHAPELRAGGELNAAGDFYALGAILFEILTGEALNLEPTDLWPGNKKPGLLPELDELVFKCLQTDPTRRIQSAAELINGVAEARRGSQAGAQDTILGMEDVLVGHTLGAYQLVERLGQGGMATVYKAYEPALDRYVAIKVLPQFFARDPNFMNRFRREAKAVAQLNHPSIMPVYSFGEEGDITYIAMQYVPGGTLKQGRGQVYEPDEAIRLALPIVRALAYAHKRGIVHRDIKPSNVLLGEDDWPVLADFGLAKMAEASQQLTGTGVGVGTPMYMSPEQGQGTSVDHRTDIYSTGIMLYEMLTGDVPFRADTPMAVVIKHMTAPLPMPRDANPDIPEALERVILKATAKSADDRFQTAEDMIEALERVQNSLLAPVRDAAEAEVTAPTLRTPVALTPTEEPAPLAKTIKKMGIYLGAVIGVILLALILMWVFDICPPEGPWPIPPWCPGSTYKLPTIGGAEETVPTPVITEGRLGAVLLQDDFEGEISSRWQFSSLPGLIPWAAEEVDGRTVMHSIPPDSQDQASGAEIRDTNWENYAIQYDFRFAKPDQFGVYYYVIEGKITDCPPTIDSLQAYHLTISSEKVILEKSHCEQGGGQTLVESDKDIDPEEWHTMQYIFIGNRIQVMIDGDSYIDIVDEDNPVVGGGDLWLSIQGGAEIYIDNLKVYEIITGEGSAGEAISASNLCAPGETLLLHENFESGYQGEWIFNTGSGAEAEPWSIVDDGTENQVIQGNGHNWAIPTQISEENIRFSLRFRKGSLGSPFHINFRMAEGGRYYLSDSALIKDPGNSKLANFDADILETDWHDLVITAVGDRIQVSIDGQNYVDYQDADPLPAGGIGIENVNDNIWYDDIVVCGVPAEEDTSVPSSSDVVIVTKTYADDFESGVFADFWFPGNLENWRIEDVGEERAIIGSGPIRIGDEIFAVQDFQFDIDINFKDQDTGGYYGAIFAFRGSECSHYLLEVFHNGGGMIKQTCNGENVNYNFALSQALSVGEWNHLQVRMVDNHIRVLVNDEMVLDFADEGESLESGSFSFWAQDFKDITYFDNFSLQELTYANEIDFFVDSGQRIGQQHTRRIAIGDIENDGDFDIAAANSGQSNSVWANTTDNLFILGYDSVDQDDSHGIFFGDYDGDTDLDLFIANWEGASYLLSNDGQGNFEKTEILESEFGVSEGFGADTGDLDGDGDLDIWLAAGGSNYVWINDGQGVFTASSTSYEGADSVGVALGDIDGDGDLDAFVANYIGGANFVYLNQGDGLFTDSGQQLGSSPSQKVALGDLDGDGDLDAFVANLEDQPNTVWINNGEGAFVDSGQQLGQLTSWGVDLGDLDNDGDLDAYVVNGDADRGIPQTNAIYLNDGSGNFVEVEHEAKLTISTDVIFLDLNGDGWLDIIEATTETILIHWGQAVSAQSAVSSNNSTSTATYEDNFENGFAEFWNTNNIDNWRIEDLEGSKVSMGIDEIRLYDNFIDFEFDIDFRFAKPYPGGNDGIYRVAFLFRGGFECSNGNHRAYELALLEHSGTLNKTSCQDGPTNFVIDYPQTLQQDEWHHVRVRMMGNLLSVWLDGEQILDVVDEGEEIPSGIFSLGVHEQNTVYFDNFSIQDLSSDSGSSTSSPCDFTLDDVGKRAKVAGTITFVDDTTPDFWYADLTADGCRLGITVNRMVNGAWFDQTPEVFELGASVIVEGFFVSFPYPNNPEQMQLILELTVQSQLNTP